MANYVRVWELNDGLGVEMERFEQSIQHFGWSLKQQDVLFEGLTLKLVVRDRRHKVRKAGKITQVNTLFMDRWETEDQLQEEMAWEEMAKRKITLIDSWMMRPFDLPCDAE